MHVMIIGAAGMLGHQLAQQLAKRPSIANVPVEIMTLVDITQPPTHAQFQGQQLPIAADLSSPQTAAQLIAARPDVIFHLAAIVSGEAEADFNKGYRINLDGSRQLFEAIRLASSQEPYFPRVVFASSLAVFGAPLPDIISDDYLLAPLTSYGTQKAISELLLSDYTRRGFMDGIAIRLPTICIRPGQPNRAASGFFSNILREPLSGKEAVLPVSEDVRHWFASPRSGVGFLLHAAAIDLSRLGGRRALSMPGVSATVGEQLAALQRVAGPKALQRIRRQPDPAIQQIIDCWPRSFDAARALALGFRADASMDDIIQVHIEDAMHGQLSIS